MRNYLHCFARVTKQLFATTLFLVISFTVFSQKKVIGTVTGSDAKPVSGATVLVKGTSTATSTAADGTYSIDLPKGKNTLTFSYVGFENYEVTVAENENSANVKLNQLTSSLNEVVVTGYTSQRK